jgi:hypothetical protein
LLRDSILVVDSCGTKKQEEEEEEEEEETIDQSGCERPSHEPAGPAFS